MDYERGLNSAFRGVFETGTICGCQFHFKSCIRKQLAALCLIVLYNENAEFQQLVGCIWGLSYIPKEKVVEAWITIIKDKVNALLDSLDKDWIPNLQAFNNPNRICFGFFGPPLAKVF